MMQSPFSSVLKAKARPGSFLLPLLVIFALVLASCGAGGSSSNGTKTTVLTISNGPIGSYQDNFNPLLASNANPGPRGMIYETLLYFNWQQGTINPWLATSYQFSSNATTLTFNLRSGVKWSDGQPFSSADVVFTLNLLKKFPALDSNGLWNYIQSVSAPGSSSVIVTFKKPYTPILWYLAGQTYIVPQHVWSTVSDPVKYLDTNPVGTGPFTLKSFSPTLIDLAKNPNYWQAGKPKVTELRYVAYDTNTTVELQLDQGSLDWTGIYTPNIQKTYIARDPNHYHYWFPADAVVMLYLNLTKAPFNDLAVRKAISLAIDRSQLDNVGESGYEPPASPTGLVLPNQQQYLDPTYANTSFTVNTSQAIQTLESAGYTRGSDGIFVDKNGHKISFSINVVTGWTDWVTDCQIMASSLKQIGMDVTVNPISFNAYYSALQLGTYDAAISWTTAGPSPFFLMNALLNSTQSAPIGQTAPSNWERWSDPTSDQLLQQYATTSDPNVQKQAMYGLEKIMVEQLPAIPLTYAVNWNEYSTLHFTGWPSPSNPYALPAPFQYPDSEITVLNLTPVS
jgi:peptide/nickel transport system substrate-binding protein